MINHDAIRALNPTIVTIRGDIAFDINEQEVSYDKVAAQAKSDEMEADAVLLEQNKIKAKESALAKLAALGLGQDEIKALIG